MISPAELMAYEIAGRQSGYVTRRQAMASGMSPGAIRHRAESGLWKAEWPGVYRIPGFEMSVRGQLAAACAALGAVVSHESAAEIHDLPRVRRGLAVVTVKVRRTHRFPDVIVHQSTDLTPEYVVEMDGLTVTSITRTIIDLAARRKPHQIGPIVDRIVVDKRATLDQICEEVLRLARRGKPGMRTMHQVLELRVGETLVGDSELELLTLRFLADSGFPMPQPQYPLPWRPVRPGRVDLAYPQWLLIIEADGRAWHSTLDAFETDRLRDNHALIAGWRVLRITYRMIKEQPEMVRNLIRRAIESSSS